jgi:hypothetical protein
MREKELISLGFKRVDIPDSESNNGYDYYYYSLKVTPEIEMVSCDSDTIEEAGWYVRNFDWPDVVIIEIDDLKELIRLLKKWTT